MPRVPEPEPEADRAPAPAPAADHACSLCGTSFGSKNQLFRHLRAAGSACATQAAAGGLQQARRPYALVFSACSEPGAAAPAAGVLAAVEPALLAGSVALQDFQCIPLAAAPRAVTAVATFSCPAAASDTALASTVTAQLSTGLAVLAAAEVRQSFGAVKGVERQRYEYILPVSALLAGPPEDEEAKEVEAEASGRLPALRASGFGFENTNWLPTTCTVANAAAGSAGDAGDAGDTGVAGGCVSTRPGWQLLRLLGRFRRLKKLLRRFEGRHNFHNFAPSADASDPAKAERTLLHCRCRGTLSTVTRGGPRPPRAYRSCVEQPDHAEDGEVEEFAVFSICGRSFLPGMVASIVGVAVAVATDRLPARYLDRALSPAFQLPLPAAPSGGGYLAETAYDVYESKTGTQLRLRPSSYTTGFAATPTNHAALAAARSAVQAAAGSDALAGLSQWESKLELGLPAMLEALVWADVAEVEGVAGGKKQQQVVAVVAPSPVLGLSACPDCYALVLSLLRQIDRGGEWPATGLARLRKIEATSGDGSAAGNGPNAVTKGDSFALGKMPPPLAQPAGNTKFANLLAACLELERALRPDRPPSTTLTINRHAQFRPHTDSGNGNGQSLSMIVALGDFTGGELIVEGVVHPIRYEPLEFDGWQRKHWTAPFTGERYSLVWYTPCGCVVDGATAD